MARRPGRHRLDHSSPLVDLDDVFADDALIDNIAASPWAPAPQHRFGAGRSPERSAPGVVLDTDPVTELFTTWRQELAERPMPALPSITPAVAELERAPARPVRKLRPALSVAAAIAALLVGSTFLGSKDAVPGSPLWGITEVLWPDRAQSVASRSEVRSALEEAQTLIDAGNPADAQLALLRATVELGNVDEVDGRGEMQQTLANLWVRTGAAAAPTVEQATATVSASASTTASPTPSSTTTVSPRVSELPAGQFADAATTTVSPSNPLALVLLAPAPSTAVNASGQAAGEVAAPASPATDSATVSAPVDPSTVSSPATDPSVTPSAPSTVPVPTVPVAPVTPSTASGTTSSQIAPAQTGPMPTPSLPGSSTGTGPATVNGESSSTATPDAAAQAIESVLSAQLAILTGATTAP